METKTTLKDLTPRETAIEMLKREVAKGIPAGGGFAPGVYGVEFMGVRATYSPFAATKIEDEEAPATGWHWTFYF